MRNLDQLYQDLEDQITHLNEELDELEGRRSDVMLQRTQMQSFMYATSRISEITVLNGDGESGDSMVVCYYKVCGRDLMLMLTEIEDDRSIYFLGHILDVDEKVPLYANTVHPDGHAYDKEELFLDLIAQYANWKIFGGNN